MAGTKHGRGAEQVSLRLPDGLRDRIKAYADRHGRSMNAEIVRILEREFPAPWVLDARVEDLLGLLKVLNGVEASEAVDRLTREMLETVQGIASGRAVGVPDDVRHHVQRRLEEWHESVAEADDIRETWDLDEQEVESRGRGFGTAKYVHDLDDEDPKP